MKKEVTIIGAGLVGSLLACYLSRRGHKVSVYERRADMRVAGYEGGRSINLALSHRGWKSLKKIGLDKVVEPIAIPMNGRMIHDLDGSTQLIPYGKEGQAIYSVSRGELNRLMAEAADEFPDVDFYFDHRAVDCDFGNNRFQLLNTRTSEQKTIQTDVVFGADGAYSEVRYHMQKTPNFNISQQHELYGYKELHIPPSAGGKHLMEKNALHIWPRKSFMLIALPNMDGSFTVTMFAPFEGENAFGQLNTANDVRAFFEKYFSDAVPLMPDLEKVFFENPTSSLVTIKCFPWKHKNTCLIGDAAHAIVPFYGQGMNCGFEDVYELDKILETTNEDWEQAMNRFQLERKPNADAIADLALYNFIEMRDLSGREDFQLRLKIEKKIAEKFGEKFMTHYSMVTFSDLSYSEAKRRGEKQNELLDKLMATPGIEQKINSEETMKAAEQWITANSN